MTKTSLFSQKQRGIWKVRPIPTVHCILHQILSKFDDTSFHSWNFNGHGWTTIVVLSSNLGQIETAQYSEEYQQTVRNGFWICTFYFNKSTEIFCHLIAYLNIVFVKISKTNREPSLIRTGWVAMYSVC